MSRKKNETFAQLIVGVFMIAVIAFLGYFTIAVSGVDLLAGRERVTMSIAFDQVGGLKDHDSVFYRGTKVGTVERVSVTPTNLIVKVIVDNGVVMRRSYRIEVCHLSMLGGNYLRLEEGLGEPVSLTETLFRGESPSDWMRDVSLVAKSMKDFMNRPELKNIVSNVAVVSQKARDISEKTDAIVTRINNGEGMVGKLVSKDAKLYDELEKAVANVEDITGRIRRGEGLVGRVLAKDDHLYDDVRESVASFRKACDSLNMGDTKADVKALIADCNRVAGNLNAVAERLRNGEGTLGRLTTDGRMYVEIEGLIRDCRQIIDNYRDTTPISTFSSLAAGAL